VKDLYYLLDLERTISAGQPFYWRQNKHGYTNLISEAGTFSEAEASSIVERDFDNATVKVHENFFVKILGKNFKQHEAIS
jgi:hypothetical protein